MWQCMENSQSRNHIPMVAIVASYHYSSVHRWPSLLNCVLGDLEFCWRLWALKSDGLESPSASWVSLGMSFYLCASVSWNMKCNRNIHLIGMKWFNILETHAHVCVCVNYKKCIFWVTQSMYVCLYAELLSGVWLFVTAWTVARKAPLSMGFSREEYWSGLPCPPPGDLHWATWEASPRMYRCI